MTETVTHYTYNYVDVSPPRKHHQYSVITYAGDDKISGCMPLYGEKIFEHGGYKWVNASRPLDECELLGQYRDYSILVRMEGTRPDGSQIIKYYYDTPHGLITASSTYSVGYVLRWIRLHPTYIEGMIVLCYREETLGEDGNWKENVVGVDSYSVIEPIDADTVYKLSRINFEPSTMYSIQENITI